MSSRDRFTKAIEDSIGNGGLFGRYKHDNGQEYIVYNGNFFKDDTEYIES